MPLQTYDTQINSVCQPFTAVSPSFDPKTLKSVYSFESNRQTSNMRCPFCGKMNVYVHARHPLLSKYDIKPPVTFNLTVSAFTV